MGRGMSSKPRFTKKPEGMRQIKFLDNDHAIARWVDLHCDVYELQQQYKPIFDQARAIPAIIKDEFLALVSSRCVQYKFNLLYGHAFILYV
jgi:hypothetical protein